MVTDRLALVEPTVSLPKPIAEGVTLRIEPPPTTGTPPTPVRDMPEQATKRMTKNRISSAPRRVRQRRGGRRRPGVPWSRGNRFGIFLDFWTVAALFPPKLLYSGEQAATDCDQSSSEATGKVLQRRKPKMAKFARSYIFVGLLILISALRMHAGVVQTNSGAPGAPVSTYSVGFFSPVATPDLVLWRSARTSPHQPSHP